MTVLRLRTAVGQAVHGVQLFFSLVDFLSPRFTNMKNAPQAGRAEPAFALGTLRRRPANPKGKVPAAVIGVLS